MALLPAFCEKTAFSTLEVATRRGLNLSPSQQEQAGLLPFTWEDSPHVFVVPSPQCTWLTVATLTHVNLRTKAQFGKERSVEISEFIFAHSTSVTSLRRNYIHANHVEMIVAYMLIWLKFDQEILLNLSVFRILWGIVMFRPLEYLCSFIYIYIYIFIRTIKEVKSG